jgi:plastocyanin
LSLQEELLTMIVFRSSLSKHLAAQRARACCSPVTSRAALLVTTLFALSVHPAMAAPFRVTVADPRGTPVADAVVTLRPVSAAARAGTRTSPATSTQPVVIQQIDREFVPRVTVVPAGSRVSLPNNDAVPHSVYSFSPAKQFEFDAYVGSSPQVLTLDKPGIITLGCNIHDWMVGYIVVVDTPLAAQTDALGAASFANIADGDYELRVWHPQQRAADYVAQITSTDQNRPQAVAIDVSPPRVRYKPPLGVKKY